MYLHGPFVDGFETCVGPYISAGTSDVIRHGSSGMLGSLISMTCGGAVALPYPLLVYRNFLQLPYMVSPSLLLVAQHPLLGIPLRLRLNWNPLLGFLYLQLDGHACL